METQEVTKGSHKHFLHKEIYEQTMVIARTAANAHSEIKEVASLINQDLTAGVHNVDFNAAGINSGVYFYRLEATGANNAKFVDVKKMILMK